MGHWNYKLDMAGTLTTYLFLGDFHTASVADDAFVSDTLVLSAGTLENSFDEVTKPETINYRTYKPERDGLFCERSETVPSSVTAKAGGTQYDNFDTDNSIMYACTPDDPETVPATVTGWLGAGRMGHGDYQWQFNNKTEDENYGVIAALKSELNAYKSSLYDLYDGVKNTNYGTFKASGGDSEKNEDYVPTYDGADTGDDDDNIVVAQKWVFTSWSSESQNTIKEASNGWTQKSDGG